MYVNIYTYIYCNYPINHIVHIAIVDIHITDHSHPIVHIAMNQDFQTIIPSGKLT